MLLLLGRAATSGAHCCRWGAGDAMGDYTRRQLSAPAAGAARNKKRVIIFVNPVSRPAEILRAVPPSLPDYT